MVTLGRPFCIDNNCSFFATFEVKNLVDLLRLITFQTNNSKNGQKASKRKIFRRSL